MQKVNRLPKIRALPADPDRAMGLDAIGLVKRVCTCATHRINAVLVLSVMDLFFAHE